MPRALEQALHLIRENRPESIDRALALMQNTVYSFSMKVCGHREDAEDTMQDVLLKSIPYLAKFENSQALTVWLYKVARNRCISSHRGSSLSRAKNLSLDELTHNSRELEKLLKSGAQPGGSPAEYRNRRASETGCTHGASAVQDGAGPARHGGFDHKRSRSDHGLARGNCASSAPPRALIRPPATGKAVEGSPGHGPDATCQR